MTMATQKSAKKISLHSQSHLRSIGMRLVELQLAVLGYQQIATCLQLGTAQDKLHSLTTRLDRSRAQLIWSQRLLALLHMSYNHKS